MKWDLTKALILDYTANNRGVVDEGPGATLGDSPLARQNRQDLRRNLVRRGAHHHLQPDGGPHLPPAAG